MCQCNFRFKIGFILFFVLWVQLKLYPQENTVGLISNRISDQGYILFNPLSNKTTYLINRQGEQVHSWSSSYVPGMTVYLREDGTLFRAGRVTDDTYINSGGAGGIIEQFNWEGEVIWHYRYSSPLVRQHHDFEILPNGNILILAWEKKTKEQAIAAGRDPNSLGTDQLWPDHLVEVKPMGESGGEIIWEWHVWDHLVQNYDPSKDNFGDVSNTELIDLNHYSNKLADWIHGNSLEYNEELDQIMISSRGFNELWIIDHSTTIEEARSDSGGRSGKGGNLLWRWGNPSTCRKEGSQLLYGQHGVYWEAVPNTGESRIYIYNNGNGRRPEIFSTIDFVDINYSDIAGYPLTPAGYFAPNDFTSTFSPEDSLSIYAPLFSNVQKMKDDHLLVCVGPRGTFIEYDNSGEEVWKYVNPVTESGRILSQGELIGDHQASINSVFSIQYYPQSFTGFDGRLLTSLGVIEGEMVTGISEKENNFSIFPNPVKTDFFIRRAVETISITNLNGQTVKTILSPGDKINVSDLEPGMYICLINQVFTLKLIVTK